MADKVAIAVRLYDGISYELDCVFVEYASDLHQLADRCLCDLLPFLNILAESYWEYMNIYLEEMGEDLFFWDDDRRPADGWSWLSFMELLEDELKSVRKPKENDDDNEPTWVELIREFREIICIHSGEACILAFGDLNQVTQSLIEYESARLGGMIWKETNIAWQLNERFRIDAWEKRAGLLGILAYLSRTPSTDWKPYHFSLFEWVIERYLE